MTVLSIGLVIVSAAVVAFVAVLLAGMPFETAFVLGAILASTDPIAVIASGRRLALPSQDVERPVEQASANLPSAATDRSSRSCDTNSTVSAVPFRIAINRTSPTRYAAARAGRSQALAPPVGIGDH